MKVEVERQVIRFVRSLAPEPRCLVRDGLRLLERETGDVRALEGELLSGFSAIRR